MAEVTILRIIWICVLTLSLGSVPTIVMIRGTKSYTFFRASVIYLFFDLILRS